MNAGSIFTIVAINGETTSLISYQCIIIITPSRADLNDPRLRLEDLSDKYECRFDRDPTNIPVSEGDIDIRSGRNINYTYDNGKHCTYLITMLIELDPL